ncbi:MAG: hypothetical protein ACREOR_03050 [Candidatus Binatia bacterium]
MPREFSSLQRSALFAVVTLAVSFYLHFNSDKFPDPDVFYHFRHAAIYAGGGLFSAGFPWVPYSVNSQYSADIWYGFHVLLIPFAWLDDPQLAMRLAGVLVTAVCLFSVYLACARLDIKPALLWPFVLLFSSAFLLHRLTMLRPQVLSLGLTVLLLAWLAAEHVRGVFLAAFAIAWLHLSLFFAPVIVLVVFAAVKLLTEKAFPWRESLALTGGLVAGWLLRPNPLGAAKIAYVQVFQFSLEKLAGAPLEFGTELRPLTMAIHSNYLAFTILWSLCLVLLIWQLFYGRSELPSTQRTVLCAAGVLSLVFFLLALLFARRAFDFCSSFGTVLIALAFGHFLRLKWLRIASLGLFVLLALYGTSLRNRVLAIGWDADRLAGAAKWLEANSKPGDIVLNVGWEYFPELFFWNTKNYYTAGMDPIFQYAYDPELYKAGMSIGAPRRSILCVTGTCPEAGADSYQIVKERFKARYVFLLKQADANIYFFLLSDKRFALRNEDHGTAVFEVL